MTLLFGWPTSPRPVRRRMAGALGDPFVAPRDDVWEGWTSDAQFEWIDALARQQGLTDAEAADLRRNVLRDGPSTARARLAEIAAARPRPAPPAPRPSAPDPVTPPVTTTRTTSTRRSGSSAGLLVAFLAVGGLALAAGRR